MSRGPSEVRSVRLRPELDARFEAHVERVRADVERAAAVAGVALPVPSAADVHRALLEVALAAAEAAAGVEPDEAYTTYTTFTPPTSGEAA